MKHAQSTYRYALTLFMKRHS